MLEDILLYSATELLQKYKNKELSPVEVMEATFRQIEKYDPRLNAFVVTMKSAAMAAARQSEARWQKGEPQGLLDGVSVAAKDLSPLKSVPFRKGSYLTSADEICEIEGPGLAAMKSHNAIIIGKTTTPEFGWKGVTDCALTGITRNPWNLDRTPGGSSGGAAAAVASKMVTLAEGTDGAGSIRIPCGFVGLFGLYPTAGRIPYFPTSTLGTMTQCGPITRTVVDGALMLSAMTGDDPRDPIGLRDNNIDWRKTLIPEIRDMKIAYSRTLGYAKPDETVVQIVDDAVSSLAEMGANIDVVEQIISDPREVFETIYSVAMARICETYSPNGDISQIDPGLLAMADYGRSISGIKLAEALTARADAAIVMSELFRKYDALITPQLSLTAFEVGRDFPNDRGMSHWFDWNPYTYPFNFTNNPAGTMPCGNTGEGLPVAFQIVAARYWEETIFRIAAAYERDHPIQLPDLAKLADIQPSK